ncbi:hypothetical protein [Xanthomonas euvesicatoria]|uniref:hypothetical protein n=1 Tax=Xanthomonas euvesicatoria TaxID=456327 RepID=UPI001C4443C7|nr:hypothetical protein [Xanthomonas euvesicatoria]MBV6829747.1 hypothetical protein [Xanthomonas campestris pv. viegasii]
MSDVVIKIPTTLTLSNALKLSIDLASIEGARAITAEFGGEGSIEPFAMLMISSELQRAAKRNGVESFQCKNHERMTYAAHMGFFDAFGYSDGPRKPGNKSGGSHHLPVNILNCEQLRDQAVSEGTEVGNVVESKSKHLAAMLCGSDQGDLFDTLSYSIREIIRNVVEHSQSEQIGICAQYWPTKNKVEVAIIDRGVGLRRTLQRNPHLDVNNDRSAVNYALMPAVSGRAFKGARQQRGPWANSGFGLYMTSRICRNGGNFFIASGESGMMLTKAKEGKSYSSCSYEGTAVRLVIKTDEIGSLMDSLKKYREDGYAFQQKYREIVNINPSAASLMLSEDFDPSVWEKIVAAFKGK